MSSTDLLVTDVQTLSFADVTCPDGWTQASDTATAQSTRLVVCYGWAGNDSSDTVGISPGTQASAVTTAYRGVSTQRPVDTDDATTGATSPSVTTTAAGELLVLGEGSSGWQATATGVSGGHVLATANNSGNSQVAVGSATASSTGSTGGHTWTVDPNSTDTVSSTLALVPGSGGSAPAPTPTSSSPAPTPTSSTTTPPGTGGSNGTAPSAPPVQVCGNNSLLAGPSSPPTGAIVIGTSQDLEGAVDNAPSGSTFYLTSGVHTLAAGAYHVVMPKAGDTFIGAPGAILDGQHTYDQAFGQGASNVTISYLTVQNFGAAGDNQNQGVINHDSGTGWTMTYDTFTGNAGAAVMLGSNNTLRYDCISNNGQYAFNAYSPSGPKNIVVDHNEIGGNNTDNWEQRQPGCGCTGGGKFVFTSGAAVTDNYVHDNHGVGIWVDTENTGFDIEGNYISGNDAEGVFYETSYNARIANNTFIKNAIVKGAASSGFPTAAIYISESGSDSRVAGAYGSEFDITGNVLKDNWGGVVLWENADRFCGSPNAGDACTMVNPSVVNNSTCNSSNINNAPYYSDCRWKTQNIKVSNNTFSLTPSNVSSACTASNECGVNGLFSQYGTYPSWSPYQGTKIEDAITYNQNNHFTNNTYSGPWQYMIHEQGNMVPFSTWNSAPYNQD